MADALKTRLKPKTSADTAKTRALVLYEALGELERSSSIFVVQLQAFVDRKASFGTESEYNRGALEARWELSQSAKYLERRLVRLSEVLDAVNPQLEIQKHLLVYKIEQFSGLRQSLLPDFEEAVGVLTEEDVEHIREIAQRAAANHLLLKPSIDELRRFIAGEFSFKDSF